jgi:hypothetical protein
MRKLLHLVFAIWKTNKPFDPAHYPWHTPAHVEGQQERAEERELADTEAASDIWHERQDSHYELFGPLNSHFVKSGAN